MAQFQARISKLEGRFGGDDLERWVRSLTDEQLDAEIERLDHKAHAVLSERGVDCADLAIGDVVARLEEIEKAEATI